jgi:hypothetical protein
MYAKSPGFDWTGHGVHKNAGRKLCETHGSSNTLLCLYVGHATYCAVLNKDSDKQLKTLLGLQDPQNKGIMIIENIGNHWPSDTM